MRRLDIIFRQDYVKNAMLFMRDLTKEDIQKIANTFGCSISTIALDSKKCILRHNNLIIEPRTDPKLIGPAIERDGNTCQYCDESDLSKPVLEHVIPYESGGHTKLYNLVCACRSCNAIKGRRIWIPNNISIIRLIDIGWYCKIINDFRHQKKYHTSAKQNQREEFYGRNIEIPSL